MICDLVARSGISTAHAGMIGGYGNDDEQDVLEAMRALRAQGVLPALSCGMHAGLIDHVTNIVGNDYMANVGGAVHGHPGGSEAGAKAIRQAIDKNYSLEYGQSVAKWGYVR